MTISPIKSFEKHFDDKELYNSLENVRTQAGKILNETIFQHFTDHSLRHSDQIIEICRCLLSDNLGTIDKKLNEYELAILIASCYLHDIGMQSPLFIQRQEEKDTLDYDTSNKVREQHAELSCTLIEKSIKALKEEVIPLGLDQNTILCELVPNIIEVCRHHNDKNYIKYDSVDSLFNKEIRRGLLIALIQFADGLDISRQRIDINKLKRFDIPIDSKIHWWRCYYIKSVLIKDRIISINMSNPNLDPLIINYFKEIIISNIEAETVKSKIILFQNNIPFHINLNVNIEGEDQSIIKIPEPIIDEIKKRIVGCDETPEKIQEKMKSFKTIKTTGQHWTTYWGFIGNPFKDNPLYFKGQEFVETSSIKMAIDELISIVLSEGGEIKLLVGERGSGKTTFFNIADEVIKSQPGFLSPIAWDMGELVELKDPKDLFNLFIKRKLYILISPENIEFTDTSYRQAVRDYHYRYKFVVFIDTLDVFDQPNEIEIIRQFFRLCQTYLQEFKRKFVIVIASSPKWKKILEDREMSAPHHKWWGILKG